MTNYRMSGSRAALIRGVKQFTQPNNRWIVRRE